MEFKNCRTNYAATRQPRLSRLVVPATAETMEPMEPSICISPPPQRSLLGAVTVCGLPRRL